MLIRTGSGTLFANTVFSLTPGITYTYRIISIDSVGNGSVGTGSFIVAHDITPERLGFGTKNTELGGTAILSNT